jgi:hypothetical protein
MCVDSSKKVINIAAKFNFMKQPILFLGFIITLVGCNNIQSKLDKADIEIEYAEQNIEEMTEKDWRILEEKMQDLVGDLEQNRDKYTNEQIKEIGKLQGRYFAVALRKGINDFQESVQDFGNQMDGFIEGIQSDTNN